MKGILLGSLARITGFERDPLTGTAQAGGRFVVEPRQRWEWRELDYVVGRVLEAPSSSAPFEVASGRMVATMPGDLVMGAFGRRAATLGAVGSWDLIGADGRFSAMTGAGLFGHVTSICDMEPALVELEYVGHVIERGGPANMQDYVAPMRDAEFSMPVVLIVGSSMSAGKTSTARQIVRVLDQWGYQVVGAKVTGAGRYRDIIAMGDAGAKWVLDFVDAGLASTVVEPATYRGALRWLMARMASTGADVAVIEAGASPLEPYNGALAVEMLSPHVACLVLCALDPYSVLGIEQAFDLRPDIVAGACANTEAGRALVTKLTGHVPIDSRGVHAGPALGAVLARRLAAHEPVSLVRGAG